MGRVSKYKKVKSVGLFSGGKNTPRGAVWGFGDNGRKQKKRSATSQAMRKRKLKRKRETGVFEDDGFDLPPQGGDEFSLSDLTIRKQKPGPLEESLVDHRQKNTTSTGLRCVIPETEKEEAAVARVLNLKEDKQTNVATSSGRMEGESKNAFNRRVKSETRQIIKREVRESQKSAKRQRKKEFLNNKKKKKKGAVQGATETTTSASQDSAIEEDTFLTGEQAAAAAAAQVAFGEQAERPPVFQQLPRGATKKVTKTSKSEKFSSMCDSQIEAEHKAMESMRRKVQAQYALVKAKRRKVGEFHL